MYTIYIYTYIYNWFVYYVFTSFNDNTEDTYYTVYYTTQKRRVCGSF